MEPRTYRVTKIDGDYAHLLNVDTGEDLLMARALCLTKQTREQCFTGKISFIRKCIYEILVKSMEICTGM